MNRQKHKLSRRILAVLLMAAMLITMFPSAMFAWPGGGNANTDAYFYVLKPDYSGTLEDATVGDYYYVGKGSVVNNVTAVYDETGVNVESLIRNLPEDNYNNFFNLHVPSPQDFLERVGDNFENVTWYRTVYSNGANSNTDTPIKPSGKCWHVDGIADPEANQYQVQFIVPALDDNPTIAVYNQEVGNKIASDNVAAATESANGKAPANQHVEWYFDRDFSQSASDEEIINKSGAQQEKTTLYIYGKYVSDYQQGELNLKIYVDDVLQSDISSSEQLDQYIARLTATSETENIDLKYNNSSVNVGYSYETYNSADLSFSVNSQYVLQAVNGSFISGDTYWKKVEQADGVTTVDNVAGNSTLEIYLNTPYTVVYDPNDIVAKDTNIYIVSVKNFKEPAGIATSTEEAEGLTNEEKSVAHEGGWVNPNTGSTLLTTVNLKDVPLDYTGWYKTADGEDLHEGSYTGDAIKNAAANNNDGTPAVIECYAREVEPAITSINKEVVEQAVTGIDGEYDYPVDGTVTVNEGDDVTLLYKITVNGDAGADFLVTDDDATLVESAESIAAGVTQGTGDKINEFTGKIPEGATSASFYVSKTFENIQMGADPVENTASVVNNGDGESPEAPNDEATVTTQVDVIPDEPTYDDLKDLIKVNIDCTTIDSHKLTDQALKENTGDKENAYSVELSKQGDKYIATITVKADPYIFDLYAKTGKTHELSGDTQDNTVIIEYGENGWTIAESSDGTVNFTVACTYDLIGISKALVTSADKEEVESAGVTVDDTYMLPENAETTITIPYNGSVTLLYKITVTGKAGAGFVVTDDGATLVESDVTKNGTVATGTDDNEGKIVGTIPEEATSVSFYVVKTFGKDGSELEPVDGKEGQYLVNTVGLAEKDDETVNPNDPTEDNTVIVPGAAQTFTLTYDANGGQNAPRQQTGIEANTSVNLSTEAPTRDGAIFMGWSLDGDNEKIYKAGEKYPDLLGNTLKIEGNTTVYAIWGEDSNGDNVADAKQVMIEPAAITIYTGGNGYEGTVGGVNGSLLENADESGLPEPGFYFTLPYDMNEAIKEAADTESAVDLSQYLSIQAKAHSETGTTEDRSWVVELYDTEGTSDVNGRYVYSFAPAAEGQDPVRMQFTDSDGNIQISDQFTISDALYQNYVMSLYTGAVDANTVQAVADFGDANTITASVGLVDSTLTIRGVSGEQTTTEINETLTGNETEITATHSEESGAPTYYINGSDIAVADQNAVQLLVDEIVSPENANAHETLLNMADEHISGYDGYELKYLDLVDTSNGNAWVTMGDTDSLTVFWPYPDGTDSDDEFTIVHYKGLDRDFNASDLSNQNVEMEVLSTEDGTLTRTEDGLVFTATSFSPYALTWEKDSSDNDHNWPPYHPWQPDGDDDGPSGLNTEDHFSYVVGYAEDYRTGEATDNEDLWPVKPNNQITRAEVATIFYRLLEDEVRDEYDTTTNDFSDVTADSWYNQTVSTLARMGIVKGYEDGSFRPNAPITRAEFGAIATRFFAETGATYEPGTFTDVTGDEWFANAIQDAVNLGLIGGYPDGTVRPNNNITRAEACAIVNRTLGRVPDADHLLPEDVMKVWPDNNPTDWFYADMQEATNGHEYAWIEEDGHEIEEWTDLLDKDWTDR